MASDLAPGERLLLHGATSLSDAELVAVLLRNGSQGHSPLDVAHDLLKHTRGLGGLASANGNLLHAPGLAGASASSVLAAIELACRLAKAELGDSDPLNHPAAVARYLLLRYTQPDQEVMGALYLDAKNRLLTEAELFRGTLSRTVVEPRAILKEALLRSACGLILFHNHPSGDPTPSAEDIQFTRRMVGAGELLGIRVVDHMILGLQGRWVSLHRCGHLDSSS